MNTDHNAPLLAVDRLVKRFGGLVATDHATLEVRQGLVRSFQITSIFPRLSVWDNLALAVQSQAGSSFAFWRPARQERQRYNQAAEVAERVGLGERLLNDAGDL